MSFAVFHRFVYSERDIASFPTFLFFISYPLWTVIISASPSAVIILPTDFLYYDIVFDPVHVMWVV